MLLKGYVMPAHPVIQTAPHHSILPAIDLECLPRLAVEFFYKGLVMPIIVVLFHSCNFSAKLQLYQNPVNASSWRQIHNLQAISQKYGRNL